jgi:hypothetical protein
MFTASGSINASDPDVIELCRNAIASALGINILSLKPLSSGNVVKLIVTDQGPALSLCMIKQVTQYNSVASKLTAAQATTLATQLLTKYGFTSGEIIFLSSEEILRVYTALGGK